MRLTLRTLLAYLDDVLDRPDAEELGKRIDESEFASGLVHRVRGSMRKLRLGAPKLDGKGVGQDPNTVAEYLDNSLPSDRIEPFEKACLESDMHLAEVASCHQVLTIVLGEPADVDPALRQKMYGIVDEYEAQRKAAKEVAARSAAVPDKPQLSVVSAGDTDDADAVGDSDDQAAKPEVPDYLKAGRKVVEVPWTAVALVVVLLLSIAVFAIGPNRIAGWLGAGNEEVAQKPETPEGDAPGKPNGQDVSVSPTDTPPTGEHQVDPGKQEPTPAKLPSKNDDSTDTTNNNAPVPATPSGPTVTDNGTNTVPNVPTPAVPTPAVPTPQVTNPAAPTPAVPTPAAPTTPAATVDKSPMAADVGRFVSEDQVLARFDNAMEAWLRLDANANLKSNDQLTVLPTYRPQLALAPGIQATLVGPAEVTLGAPLPDGFPQLSIAAGRAILRTAGQADMRVAFDLGGLKGTAALADVTSSLAIDVSYFRDPGRDPEKAMSHRIVQLVASHGTAYWVPEVGDTITLSEGQVLVYVDNVAPQAGSIKAMPEWVNPPRIDTIDQLASRALAVLIDSERPLLVSLEESVDHKNVEVRTLAARCLGHLGYFDPFVPILRDKRNKSFWHAHFLSAQEALARSPEMASAVRVAIEKEHPDDSADLYRLLWGYSDENLAGGSDAKLVEYLDHADLEYRVLAFENLRHITGLTKGYRPEVDHFRSAKLRSWREALAEKLIRNKSPLAIPSIIPLKFEPAAAKPLSSE